MGQLLTYDADFGVTLDIFWGHFGVTLGALAASGGDFGDTLRSLWGQFGVSLGICG